MPAKHYDGNRTTHVRAHVYMLTIFEDANRIKKMFQGENPRRREDTQEGAWEGHGERE
jgi:hypothetical protein